MSLLYATGVMHGEEDTQAFLNNKTNQIFKIRGNIYSSHGYKHKWITSGCINHLYSWLMFACLMVFNAKFNNI
jgi:hypothetical protein